MDSVKIMRWVQVGILIFLIIVASFLFAVWRQRSNPPANTTIHPPSGTAPQSELPTRVGQRQSGQEIPLQPPAKIETETKTAEMTSSPSGNPPKGKIERTKVKIPSPSRKTPPKPKAAVTAMAKADPPPQPPGNSNTSPLAILPPPQDPRENLNSAEKVEKVPELPPPIKVRVPAGTNLVVRLMDTLSTDRNQAGDRFTATLDEPLFDDGHLIADSGAPVTGRVLEVRQAGRISGLSQIFLDLTHLQTVSGNLEISTESLNREANDTKKKDAKTVGALAGIGAVIGAIAGGGKGAAIGAAAGGGAGAGTVLATRGNPAQLERETQLTFILKEPLSLSVVNQQATPKTGQDRKRLEGRF
jgi:hypothetical protein